MLKQNRISALLAVLALLVLLSCVMLSGQLLTVNQSVPRTTIAVAIPRDAKLSAIHAVRLSNRNLLEEPRVSVHDNKQTWDTDTQVDIFCATYENESGQITVDSPYGDHLIAPGTANDYEFYIENTGDVTLNYSLEAEGTAIATIDGIDYEIPIQARFYDSYDQMYLLGTETLWMDLEALDTVADSGTIASGKVMKYVLHWQWPFEQESGDAYDTLLGNMAAAGDDLTVRVRLAVTVSAADDPQAPGGDESPKTGDDFNIMVWMILGIVSFAALLVTLNKARKGDAHEKA